MVFAPHHVVNMDMLQRYPDMQPSFRDAQRLLGSSREGTYRVRFIGDSTMRNLFHASCMLLNQPIDPTAKTWTCQSQLGNVVIETKYESQAFCVPMVFHDDFVNVRGCGLWYLNPRPFTHYSWNAKKWSHLHRDAHRMIRAHISTPCSTLIVSLPHHVCTSETRKPCDANVSNTVCKLGQRNSLGAMHASTVLRDAAKHFAHKRHRVMIFDAHALTMNKCHLNFDDDDLHFHRHIFSELQALWTRVLNIRGWRNDASAAFSNEFCHIGDRRSGVDTGS